MTITIWYKDAIDLNIEGYQNATPPNSRLIKATVISSQRYGWYKVLTSDGKFDTVNDRQIFFSQQGKAKRIPNKEPKYPEITIHWSGFELWFTCFGWQIVILIFCNILAGFAAYADKSWMTYAILQIIPGLFIYGMMVALMLHTAEGYKLIKKYKEKS